jgi:hypothetical protein
MYLNHKFITTSVSEGKTLFPIWIKDDLHNAFTVTEIQENDATMVTTTMYPPAKDDLLTAVGTNVTGT